MYITNLILVYPYIKSYSNKTLVSKVTKLLLFLLFTFWSNCHKAIKNFNAWLKLLYFHNFTTISIWLCFYLTAAISCIVLDRKTADCWLSIALQCGSRGVDIVQCSKTDCWLPIECFHSRGQHVCKFDETKENVCIRKQFNSHRIGLGQQHGRRFIVLGHQYGRRDVMWKHSIVLQCGYCSVFYLINQATAFHGQSSICFKEDMKNCHLFVK